MSGKLYILIESILEKSKGRCWYCGREITVSSRNEPVHSGTYAIDHFLPKIEGGGDDANNLVPACFSCNSRKKNKSLEEFRALETRLRNNAPAFTDEQIYYLSQNGIELPRYNHHRFYFEIEGLEP